MVDALQFTEEHGEVCPAGWHKGDSAMKPDADGVSDYLRSNADNLWQYANARIPFMQAVAMHGRGAYYLAPPFHPNSGSSMFIADYRLDDCEQAL